MLIYCSDGSVGWLLIALVVGRGDFVGSHVLVFCYIEEISVLVDRVFIVCNPHYSNCVVSTLTSVEVQ